MTITAEIVFAFIVGSIAVGRMARFVVDDDFPLFVPIREWWKMNTGSWAELALCPFCISIWIGAASAGWAFASDLHWTWWLWHLWLAGSYVGAIIVGRDIPPEG